MALTENITGVFLSGGKNSRYGGQDKAFIQIDGKTILENTLEVFDKIFSDILIISNDPKNYNELCSFPVYSDIVTDIGPLGGIHSALTNCKTEAAFIIASDMPFPDEELIRELVDHYNENHSDILIPLHKRGIEPLHGIYSTKVLPELNRFLDKTKKYSMRDFFPKVNTKYYHIPGNHGHKKFTNINDYEDLSRILSRQSQ